MNSEKECRIGPYAVDGYCLQNNCVYEYQGCYHHALEGGCRLLKHIKDEQGLIALKDKLKRTREKNDFLKKSGYNLVTIQECEFQDLVKVESSLQEVVQEKLPPFYRKYKGCVSEDLIIKSVLDNNYFGILEVDISVPNVWQGNPPNETKMSPYDYFKEMSPLFCNVNVNFEDIGEYMQNYVKETKLSTGPRRLLVGGMRARKILLASPLLKWYIEHGLVVTKIYQCIEFVPAKCFKNFTEEVTASRRLGDSNPDCEVIASTMKLIGNSAYGSLLMDKEKFQNVRYVSGHKAACTIANQKRFKSLTELGKLLKYY